MDTQGLCDVFLTDRVPILYSPKFVAPANLYLRPGNTLLPPRWTRHVQFRRAGIAIKIERGTIAIPHDAQVAGRGDRIRSSSFLLNVLNVSPTT